MLDYNILLHAKPGFCRYMPHFNVFITEPVTTGLDRFFCGFLRSWSAVMSLSVAMREPTKTNASALGSSITKN